MTGLFYRKRLQYLCVALALLLMIWGSAAQTINPVSHVCPGVCDLAWSPDGNVLAAVNRLGLWLYNAQEDDAPRLFTYKNLNSLDFSPNGERIAVTSCSPPTSLNYACRGKVSFFDLRTQTFEDVYVFEFEINDVQFSPDNQFIAVYQAKPREWGMRVINLNSGRMVSIVSQGITNIISGYDFSDDGRYIAIATLARNNDFGQFSGVTIWDIFTGHRVAMYPIQGFVSDVNFSSDNEVTVVRHFYESDATVYVWNFENASFQRRFTAHLLSDRLNDFALSEDLNYLSGVLVTNWTEIRERSFFVWEVTTGEALAHVNVPDQYVDVFAVNPTANRIANTSSLDEERRVDVWDVEQVERRSFFLHD